MLLNLPEPSFYTSHVTPLFVNPQRDPIISKQSLMSLVRHVRSSGDLAPDHRASASLIPHTHPEIYILSILKSCTLHSDSCWSLLKLFLNLAWQSNMAFYPWSLSSSFLSSQKPSPVSQIALLALLWPPHTLCSPLSYTCNGAGPYGTDPLP